MSVEAENLGAAARLLRCLGYEQHAREQRTRQRPPTYNRWGRGEGVGAASFRTAPRPSALRRRKTKTRTVTKACRILSAAARL